MAESFKYGNGVWATKEGLSLAYNDENDNYKPLPFSVTRDSIATRVNKEGLIEVVGKDKLRIDYTDSTKGVALLEPARTNTFLHSEDISNSVWTSLASGETIVSNSIISPDGTQNADTLEGDGTATNVYIRQDVTLSTSTNYTFSIFAKKGTNNFLAVSGEGFTSATNTIVIFDLENIIVTTGTGNIEDYGNGWLRCIFTTSISTDGTGRFLIYPAYNGTTRAFPSSSDADGQNIYLWGAMIEQGSYATSYIPTSGSATQRQADVANGAGNSEVFNDSEGVLFADTSSLQDVPSGNMYFGISSGALANSIFFRFNTAGDIVAYNAGLGSSNIIALKSANEIDLTIPLKIAIKYGSINSDFSVYLNGFEVTQYGSFSATAVSGLSKFDFALYDGTSSPLYGKTKRIGYFDAVLTDAELEALTSYTSFTNMANELNLTIK